DATITRQDEVAVWGSGTPRREFLHVDDLADACLFLMQEYEGDQHINVGTGEDLSIRGLAGLVAGGGGYGGAIPFAPSRPGGPPRKLLDVSRIREAGWKPQIPLREGVRQTYVWFL